MKLHTLTPARGSLKNCKRVGRGQGSGRGGTSTRGHNGNQSRSGYKTKAGFEGGQNPLHRRLPKFGFKCPSRVVFTPLNLSDLQHFADKYHVSKIDQFFLRKHRIIGRHEKYKILGNGVLGSKLSVSAHRCSASALKAIEGLGGEVVNISIYE